MDAVEKAEIYKSVRDSSAVGLNKKHVRQFDHEFLHFTGADPSMSVLDIGCGVGVFMNYLRHRGFSDVTGIDYDEGVKDALTDFEAEGYKVEIADAEAYVDAVTGQQTFDRIVMFDILEHMYLDDCIRFFKKLRGLLNDRGHLLIRVPNLTSPWAGRLQFDSFDHVTMFTPGRLQELAKITGFEVAAIRGQTTGKRRKVFFQNMLHKMLSHVLTYHPEIWEAAIICSLRRAPSKDGGG